MSKPHVVILGAGPAGLGAAYQLARRQLAWVTVLEETASVGGNSGSFELAGARVDYGSHRLHPACDSEVLRDIRALLDDDLLDRPRHGRIRLRGRWIHFPLKPLDLALGLSPSFALGVATGFALRPLRRTSVSAGADGFAAALEAGLGQTICREFYFPYARKIWGLEPEELSVSQARRRVSANSLGKMARKVLLALPGLKPRGSGRFYYPRHGFGQIFEAYYWAALEAGAYIQLNSRVRSVEVTRGAVSGVQFEKDGQSLSLRADLVWSTIPITTLIRHVKPGPPEEYLSAAENLDYRAMILIYLVLEQDRFSEYDAHYFPEPGIPISRLSEPKNYSNYQWPQKLTVLCAELPCARDDRYWDKGDEELGRLVLGALESAGIPVRSRVERVVTRRLRRAYPIYRQGYEAYLDLLDRWVNQVSGLLTFGRQGLFAHDNTHHALYMGYSAVACLDDNGVFDKERWQTYRSVFDTHVVED